MAKRLQTNTVMHGKAQIPPDDRLIEFRPHANGWISEVITEAEAAAIVGHPMWNVIDVKDGFTPDPVDMSSLDFGDRQQVERWLRGMTPDDIAEFASGFPAAMNLLIVQVPDEVIRDLVIAQVDPVDVLAGVSDPVGQLSNWVTVNADMLDSLRVEAIARHGILPTTDAREAVRMAREADRIAKSARLANNTGAREAIRAKGKKLAGSDGGTTPPAESETGTPETSSDAVKDGATGDGTTPGDSTPPADATTADGTPSTDETKAGE